MDSLVLDIGGDVGALLLVAGPELAEQEIEISPGTDPATPRSHNGVHARRRPGPARTWSPRPAGPAGWPTRRCSRACLRVTTPYGGATVRRMPPSPSPVARSPSTT